MIEISGNLELRPTRIGFLTRPTDLRSVRAIMRACTCVWGGAFNPIIPVYIRSPKDWRSDAHSRIKVKDVPKGYVRFFEPDVFVEAEQGLLEAAGLGALRTQSLLDRQVLTLDDFLKPMDDRAWSYPRFGLSIYDVLAHLHRTERRFVLRDQRESLRVAPERASALTEAVFGVYPESPHLEYVASAYSDVFAPAHVAASPETWRRVCVDRALTPLKLTRHGLEAKRSWNDDLLIFVFDHERTTDLIDLWNLRLEPRPVLPLPIQWIDTLRGDILRILEIEHRPVVGNPYGVMHHATIEFARSVPRPQAEAIASSLAPNLPPGALSVKCWRNAIWIEQRDRGVVGSRRLKVVAREQRVILTLKQDDLITTFRPIQPDWASNFGMGIHRWVNVLRLSHRGSEDIATVFPFNTFDRTWPNVLYGRDAVHICSEGWIFSQQLVDWSQSLVLSSGHDAIVGWLTHIGIDAQLSEPGHIARQMLMQLGGLHGVRVLADIETLKLLNNMAGGKRVKRADTEIVEEQFGLRTAPKKTWDDLVSRRIANGTLPKLGLDAFIRRNVIQIGIETRCPHCKKRNWSSLSDVDYQIDCERCLKTYAFPQASLQKYNQNWTYRVVGPFSVTDFGKGSYSALLTLWFLEHYNASASSEMTFSTAVELAWPGHRYEVDLLAWRGGDYLRESHRPPELVVGECKSLGKRELIGPDDVRKLRRVAGRLPESIIVISVLRGDFTKNEVRLLRAFVKWGRRLNQYGEQSNPVLLLTEHELMSDYLPATWKKLGGRHALFTDMDRSRDLSELADATQQIYLGIPSFHQVRHEYWEKRTTRRRAKRTSKQVGKGEGS